MTSFSLPETNIYQENGDLARNLDILRVKIFFFEAKLEAVFFKGSHHWLILPCPGQDLTLFSQLTDH